MEILCPQCRNVTSSQGSGQFKCGACEACYSGQALCPDCEQPLEKLQGCGATDYFCRNGHGLVSKKRIIWKL